jgi:hypothetical protein
LLLLVQSGSCSRQSDVAEIVISVEIQADCDVDRAAACSRNFARLAGFDVRASRRQRDAPQAAPDDQPGVTLTSLIARIAAPAG